MRVPGTEAYLEVREALLRDGSRRAWLEGKTAELDAIKPSQLTATGTLEVIEHALKQQGVNMGQLNIEIRLGSTESIKQYLLNAPCMAFISIHTITEELKRQELKVIEVADLTMERDFYLIHRQGKMTGISELFAKFASHIHNLK